MTVAAVFCRTRLSVGPIRYTRWAEERPTSSRRGDRWFCSPSYLRSEHAEPAESPKSKSLDHHHFRCDEPPAGLSAACSGSEVGFDVDPTLRSREDRRVALVLTRLLKRTDLPFKSGYTMGRTLTMTGFAKAEPASGCRWCAARVLTHALHYAVTRMQPGAREPLQASAD